MSGKLSESWWKCLSFGFCLSSAGVRQLLEAAASAVVLLRTSPFQNESKHLLTESERSLLWQFELRGSANPPPTAEIIILTQSLEGSTKVLRLEIKHLRVSKRKLQTLNITKQPQTRSNNVDTKSHDCSKSDMFSKFQSKTT